MSIFADIQSTFSRRDNALNQLLVINVLVFVGLNLLRAILYLAMGTRFGHMLALEWLAIPSNPLTFAVRPWTLLTYCFTQFEFFHILFNLLNLYWFGALVREYLGDRRLISVYILGAFAGAIFYLACYNLLPAMRDQAAMLYGASASVTAIIVAAATLLPDYTFNLFLIGPVRIKYIAAVVVVISIAGISGDNTGGQLAHLGGAMLGYAYIRLLQRGRDMGRPIIAVGEWISALLHGRPRLRVTHRSPQEGATTNGKRSPLAQPAQEEIDRILDKISRSGYESLSREEKQKLFKASQK